MTEHLVDRKMNRRALLKLMGVGTAATALAACAPAATPTTAPATEPTAAPAEEGGTLTFPLNSPWGSYSPLRPTYMYSYSTNHISGLTHSGLIRLDRNSVAQPDLATTWEISEDGTKYTFKLRTDAKWHDGEPVTARDVEATVKLILTEATNILPLNWTGYIKGSQAFFDGDSDDLPGVQLIDDYNIAFELESPTPSWHVRALPDLNILPAHIFSDVNPEDIMEQYAPAWFDPKYQIGSGPFKFVRAERDQFVELERFDDYFLGTPKLERIIYKSVGGVDTQFIAFEKGELDIWNVPSDYLERAKAIPNITPNIVNRNYIRAMLLHYEGEHLADKRVRQALAYGIDRQGLCDSLANGLCRPYASYMEIQSWLAPDLNPYPYDPEKAKQLLAEAEADGTWDPTWELKAIWYYSDPFHQDWFAAIQQQLAQIGVTIKLQYMEGTNAVAAQAACEFDLYYQGWGFSSPEDYASFFTKSERCKTPWSDPEADQWFEDAQTETDENARREIYNKIQVKLNEELPMIPFVQFLGVTGVNDRVKNFDDDALWWIWYPWFNAHHNAHLWAVTE